MLNALGQLKISAPENIMTYITLESPCKKLKPYINVFERYRKDVPDKKLYVRLFNAIQNFHSVYCGRDERYRKMFSQQQEELLKLHENFEDCEGEPDWYENGNATVRCVNARNIMNCYSETLRIEIGSRVARAWNCIFERVINEAMVQSCNFTVSKRGSAFDDDNDVGVSSGAKSKGFAAMILFVTTVGVFAVQTWIKIYFILRMEAFNHLPKFSNVSSAKSNFFEPTKETTILKIKAKTLCEKLEV